MLLSSFSRWPCFSCKLHSSFLLLLPNFQPLVLKLRHEVASLFLRTFHLQGHRTWVGVQPHIYDMVFTGPRDLLLSSVLQCWYIIWVWTCDVSVHTCFHCLSLNTILTHPKHVWSGPNFHQCRRESGISIPADQKFHTAASKGHL